MQMDKSIFSIFVSLFDSPFFAQFFSFILLLCFLDFADLLFGFPMFFFMCLVFSKFVDS